MQPVEPKPKPPSEQAPSNDVVRFRKRSQIAVGMGVGLDKEFKVEMVTTDEGRSMVVLRVGQGQHSALIKVPPGHLALIHRPEDVPAEVRACAARLARFKGPITPQTRRLLAELGREGLIMMFVVIGRAPIVALGLVAWWARARSSKLEIVNLLDEAPAEKRAKRSKPVEAVVLHQMSFSRGDDLRRYKKVTDHFVIAPNGGVAQLHPLSARLSSSHGFNGRSVAIESAGNLIAASGRWWRPEEFGRDSLTPAQVESGRRLLRLLSAQGVRYRRGHGPG